MRALQSGQKLVLIANELCSGIGYSEIVAVPRFTNGAVLTWENYVSEGALSALDMSLLGSEDASNFHVIDRTATPNDLRTIHPLRINFIRTYRNSSTGSGKLTVTIMV